ncbi:hypothetical protein AAZX31_10G016000 [Glycine max]|nr:hypothetical protein GLYMA_10G015966v4 [Glycine max]KAH1136260.1 hypothetical protein GYH30_026654 [Glycine max]|eukprot:XP_025979801.1 uncharacterized protein LOC102660904 [Glycine max]
MKGRKTGESITGSYYVQEDLRETYREWSAYGVDVVVSPNGEGDIKMYYVPFLSAIQLYVVRACYKCTSAGCCEGSTWNGIHATTKNVITTYEGRYNHEQTTLMDN